MGHLEYSKIKGRLRWAIRKSRKAHKYIGLFLAAFLLILSITGILLAWKKDIPFLQPAEQPGTSADISTWLSTQELKEKVVEFYLYETGDESNSISRVDIRLSQGTAKFIFKNGYWEVQIDCTTGEILSFGRRYSDLIESIHDGSIVSHIFKIISMNSIGFALIACLLFGVLLWSLPKKYKIMKRKSPV